MLGETLELLQVEKEVLELLQVLMEQAFFVGLELVVVELELLQ